MNASMLSVPIENLPVFLLGAWHFYYLHMFIAAVALLLLLVPRLTTNPYLLRNSFRAGLFFVLVVFLSGLADFFGLKQVSLFLDELAQVFSGVFIIHLSGLTVFRILLPKMNLFLPRILEDLLMVFVYLAWMLMRLRFAGLDFSSLVTTSAVVTGIIAFSMQETLSNILGGLALQVDKSINIGDWVKVDDVSGRVIQVSWRHTAIRTRNGEIVIMPNSILMKAKFSIVGGEDVPQWRRWINFSTADNIPPQKIIDIINKSLADADIPSVSKKPLPDCLIMSFIDGYANYSLRYWLTDPAVDDPTDSEVRLHIFANLKRHGYALMHPCLDVKLTENNTEHEAQLRAEEIAIRERTLRKIDLFRDLSDEEIQHLANTLIYAPFARGSVITRQGAVAHWLYVLIRGEADVWHESPHQERMHLAKLVSGQIFGEQGLMTGEPRRATVTAHTDAECYRIDKKSFEQILQTRPNLAEAFAHILMDRNQQLVDVATNPINTTKEQQKSVLLDNIRRFFRLEI